MTLRELEQLIRRIEEAMERPPGDGALPRLAGEYASACRIAAQRLSQCAVMLAAGDEHQALQLAETAPALLDQLTFLSFRRSPNFRVFCQSQNLPAPELFDIKSVRQLNELYAKGIDKDHALYREYRRAIMVNDDARALAVLRSITRLNANDKNAAAELARFEHKYQFDKIQRLERLVRDRAPASEIAALAEELETVPETRRSSAWIPAQTIRGAWLVEQAREAQRAVAIDDFQQILARIPGVAHLLTETDRKSIDELERWFAAETTRRKEAANRRAAIVQLSETVTRIELEQIASKKRSIHDFRSSADELDRAWRQVEAFRAEIAGDVANRAQKLKDALRVQIDRSLRASRRLAFSAVALVLIICAAAAWISYSRQAAHSLANRIQTAIAERHVSETESLLAQSTNDMAAPVLLTACRSATEFVTREITRKTVADQSIAAIEAHARANFTNAPPEQIAAKFEAARNANAALAPEFRPAAAAALDKLNRGWQEFLRRESEARTARLTPSLDRIESDIGTGLQYYRDPEDVLRVANALQMQLDSVRRLVEPRSPSLPPKQEVRFRFENFEAQVQKFSRDATNWFVAQRKLSEAANLTSYDHGLQLLATNGFTPQGQRASILALASLNLSDQTLMAPLLLSNGPASALAEAPRASRVPDEILPAEREVQRRLRDDENIQSVSRLEIEIKELPAENSRRRRIVFLRGELQRRITRRAGQIYDPVENPSALQFESKEMSSLDYAVEEPTPTPEHELYDRAGLSRLIDSNSGKYQVSLLQSLDEINQDRRANPLFRAWLFLQIGLIIDAQPHQWGAIWSPAYAADRAALERLGARQIQSGDWFVPAANAQRTAALSAHFDRAALRSYARQSAFFKRLLPKAAEIGLRVIGYIDGNAEPVITDMRVFYSVYALTAPDQPPQLIFDKLSPNYRPRALVSAMSFSPLFVFGGNATELINSTLQSLSYSASGVNLPESLPPILRALP